MLHLANGEAAADALREHLPEGRVLAFPFPLSCGPVGANPLSPIWLRDVTAFWKRLRETNDDVAGKARKVLDSLVERVPLVVWVGSDCADQLLAAMVCYLLRARQIPEAAVRFAFLDPADGMDSASPFFAQPKALARAHQRAALLTDPSFSAYAAAWQAWTSADPATLDSLLSDSHLPMPLDGALRTLLGRYPDERTGLAQWDLRILHHVAQRGPSVVRSIGFLLVEGMEQGPDLVGDGWLYWRMRRLAAPELPQPLLAFDQDSPDMRGRTAHVTRAGEAVLDGKLNALTLNGLTDQIGGVTISYPREPVWVRSAEGLKQRAEVSGAV